MLPSCWQNQTRSQQSCRGCRRRQWQAGNQDYQRCHAGRAEHKPKRRLPPDRVGTQSQCRKAEQSESTGNGCTLLPPPLKAPRVGASGSLRAGNAQALERERLTRRVDEIGSALSVSAGRPSARERMAALRQRVGLAPGLPTE